LVKAGRIERGECSCLMIYMPVGANHVCSYPLHPEGQPLPDYDALPVLAA
jgi:hypothetical protein